MCDHILLNLLNVVTNEELSNDDKISEIEKITGFKLHRNDKEVLGSMCNVSEGLMQYAAEKTKVQLLKNVMDSMDVDVHTAMDILKIQENQEYYIDLVNEMN